jgi:hypothetical protein
MSFGFDPDLDDDGKQRTKLETPIYRIKLQGVNMEDRRIGRMFGGKEFSPVVFDARKSKTQKKDVVAKVKSNGEEIDITIDNVKHYITYLSLTTHNLDLVDYYNQFHPMPKTYLARHR